MLIYFHKNKLRYEKGQMAPFFILILVLLIVMAMVTVNLSKVAFIKTDSSNAVDSGALASGSVMANVFNALASANSQMEAFYWEFYASVSILFSIAFLSLTLASTSAGAALASATSALAFALGCSWPCDAAKLAQSAVSSTQQALGWLGSFIKTTRGISTSVTAFSIAQYFFYLSIRDMAEEGREQAIKLGHNFAFINSGIGSKLKEGSPPEELTEPGQKNNYRNEFSRFLAKEIGPNPEYTYAWEDGQQREHYVRVEADIDAVDTFDLKAGVLPLAAELALLVRSLSLAFSAQASLTTAQSSYATALAQLNIACGASGCCFVLIPIPHCCVAYHAACKVAESALATGISANSAAISTLPPIFPLLATAGSGLLPGPIITSSSTADALAFILSWTDDIVHNRLVKVDTTQQHQGEDLGLWQTTYPQTRSYSIVDFRGKGQIHPPNLRHDASITETDKIGSSAP